MQLRIGGKDAAREMSSHMDGKSICNSVSDAVDATIADLRNHLMAVPSHRKSQ